MHKLRPFIPWLTLSAPMLLMLGVIMLACGSESGVFAFFRQHRIDHPTLKVILTQITNWSNVAFYAWFAWLLIKSLKQGDKATTRFVVIYIAVQVAIALVAARLLKITIARPRPGEGPFPPGITFQSSYNSMPSGHTTEITASAMTQAGRIGTLKAHLLFGLIAAVVGFSRIYLGWHHPSDVLCGWMLGSVAGMAVHVLAAHYALPAAPSPATAPDGDRE